MKPEEKKIYKWYAVVVLGMYFAAHPTVEDAENRAREERKTFHETEAEASVVIVPVEIIMSEPIRFELD